MYVCVAAKRGGRAQKFAVPLGDLVHIVPDLAVFTPAIDAHFRKNQDPALKELAHSCLEMLTKFSPAPAPQCVGE